MFDGRLRREVVVFLTLSSVRRRSLNLWSHRGSWIVGYLHDRYFPRLLGPTFVTSTGRCVKMLQRIEIREILRAAAASLVAK